MKNWTYRSHMQASRSLPVPLREPGVGRGRAMRLLFSVLLVSLFLPAAVFATGAAEAPGVLPPALAEASAQPLRLATTTSTDNTGLLGYLMPVFTERYGISVDVVAVGTGAALELGRNGDADVVMVHARSLEDEFVEQGFGINRRDLMYNDFVVLGPANDPAGVRQAQSAADAFALIAGAQAPFISRGDNSGTYVRELSVWTLANLEPTGTWYQEVGQGMGAVIGIADEQQGYTLADRGTYLAFRGEIELEVVFDGDPSLFNPYGIIAVDPQAQPDANYVGAMALITFLTSPEGQRLIGDFLVEGEQLFVPTTR